LRRREPELPHPGFIGVAIFGVNHPLTKNHRIAFIRQRVRPSPARYCEHRNKVIREGTKRVMTELTGKVGFASPISKTVLSKKRILGVELAATLALAVSLIIAATAVSFGVARAQSMTVTRIAGTGCFKHPTAVFCTPHARIPTLRP
jgi:hypothetical protein